MELVNVALSRWNGHEDPIRSVQESAMITYLLALNWSRRYLIKCAVPNVRRSWTSEKQVTPAIYLVPLYNKLAEDRETWADPICRILLIESDSFPKHGEGVGRGVRGKRQTETHLHTVYK